MLKNENIICISSIDWDFIWQGHQEIMTNLSKNGNRVFFIDNTGVRLPGIRDIPRIKSRIKNWLLGVNGIREKGENLYVFSPLIVPFPYLRIATWINRHLILSVLEKWIKIVHFSNPVIWVFLPTPLTLKIIDSLDYKLVVYYCIDNFRVSSASTEKIKKSEIKLLKRADLVFVTSNELYGYCSKYNDRVYFFPFAVNFGEFEKARLAKDYAPDELEGIKRPIIGYVGGVHKWIDLELVKETSRRHPQFSFVFVGPIQTDVSSLSGLKNIHLLGIKEHNKIPYFIKNFDLCIIPYLITDYTRNVYPTKLNEYLAMGKPVLSTDLPEVRNFNNENGNPVSICGSREEFIASIPKAFGDTSSPVVERRIACARRNSWAERIEGMSSLIERAIDKKSKLPLNWRENLLKLYKLTRRKTLKLAFISLSIYFSIFYTPLVWILAKPIKIVEVPQKTDVIVVFAGGVGESGKAGQGYEERVDHAVKLYKQGYASHIIFSSGYKFIFREAEVMKSLSIGLGVPSEAITLEENAGTTYENIKFVREILDKKKWRKALLVSSPYHMGRVSLVARKIAPEINFIYTPSNSSFYGYYAGQKKTPRGISLKQIKGIIHEYLGIAYYWLKGYI